MFDLAVKTLDGRDYQFTVEDDILVSAFKELIRSRMEIPVDQQRLIFQGRVLQDDSVLKGSGVENKVVHLVTRPPPSTRAQSNVASSDPQESRSTPVTSSNSPIDLLANRMSQAIGTFATIMLNELESGGSRPGSEQVRAGPGVDFVTPHARLMTMLETTFNRLHRQSVHLVRRIRQSSVSMSTPWVDAEGTEEEEEVIAERNVSSAPETLVSSPSYSLEERLICGACRSRVEGLTNSSDGVTDSGGVHEADTVSRPLAETFREVDETEEADVAASEDNADDQACPAGTSAVGSPKASGATRDIDNENETTSSGQQPQSRDTSGGGRGGVAISTLANMLARHRELWRSAEPYMDQWETMLRKESQLQEAQEMSQGQAGTSSEDSTERSRTDIWNSRFFCQISRLLHLNSHMLHLISDVNVINLNSGSTATRAVPQTAQDTTTTATETTDPAALAATTGTTETTPVLTTSQTSAVPPPTSDSGQDARRQRPWRILVDGSFARNRPGFEAHPRVTWSSSVGGTGAPGMTVPTPVVTTTHAMPAIPTRRSHSATDLHRGRSPLAATQQATAMPVGSSLPAGTRATRSQFSVGNGSATAIIHRFDIPIVSMNMINMPNMRFMPVSGTDAVQLPFVTTANIPGIGEAAITSEVVASTDVDHPMNAGIPVAGTTIFMDDTVGATAEATTGSSSFSTSTTTTVTSGGGGGASRASTAGNRRARMFPFNTMGPVDPYLPCHSRHFGLNSQSMPAMNEAFVLMPSSGRTATWPTHSSQPAASAAPSATALNTSATTTTTTRSSAGPHVGPTAQAAQAPPFSQNTGDGDIFHQLASVLSAVGAGALQGQTAPFNIVGSAASDSSAPSVTVSTASSQSSPTESGGQVPPPPPMASSLFEFPGAAIAAQISGLPSMLFGGGGPFSSAMSMFSNLLNPQSSVASNRAHTVEASDSPPTLVMPRWADCASPVCQPASTATTPVTTPPTTLTPPSGEECSPPPAAGSPEPLVDRLLGPNGLLPVFIDAAVHSVWLRLAQAIASDHPNGDDLRLDSEIVGGGSAEADPPFISDRRTITVPVGFLTDVLDAVRPRLTPADSVNPSNLDGLRPIFQQLIFYADQAIQSLGSEAINLPDLLLNCVFNYQTSDNRLLSSQTRSGSSVEERTLAWVNRQLGAGAHVIDIRATVARFVRAHLSLQTDLWRSSPTNVGFGSTLLMAFGHGCVELLSLLDSLIGQLASRVDLVVNQPSDMIDFESVRSYLERFVDGFQGSDANFIRQIVLGIDQCIDRYQSTSEGLRQLRIDQPPIQAMVYRTVPPISQTDSSSPSDADMADASEEPRLLSTANQEEVEEATCVRGSQRPLTATTTATTTTTSPPTPTVSSNQLANRCSPLPDWSDMPSVTRPLDRHAARQQPVTPTPPATTTTTTTSPRHEDDWQSGLPSQWVNVVSEDVARMAATLGGVQQPATARQDDGDAVVVGCEQFSDGYLAGMPAKRRKVVEERKLSLIKSPKSMFTECLTDAIRTSGCQPPAAAPPSQTTVQQQTVAGTQSLPTAEEGQGQSGSPTGAAATREQVELVLALRNLVSERIANRLTTDPDFDAALFPMSNKVFCRNNLP